MSIFTEIYNYAKRSPVRTIFSPLVSLTIERTKDRGAVRKKLGINDESLQFWTAYSGRDEKGKERYRTENPLFEEQMRKNHPNYTEEQFDNIRDNHIRKEILKNSKHPAVKDLYNSIFDKDGNITPEGA